MPTSSLTWREVAPELQAQVQGAHAHRAAGYLHLRCQTVLHAGRLFEALRQPPSSSQASTSRINTSCIPPTLLATTPAGRPLPSGPTHCCQFLPEAGIQGNPDSQGRAVHRPASPHQDYGDDRSLGQKIELVTVYRAENGEVKGRSLPEEEILVSIKENALEKEKEKAAEKAAEKKAEKAAEPLGQKDHV